MIHLKLSPEHLSEKEKIELEFNFHWLVLLSRQCLHMLSIHNFATDLYFTLYFNLLLCKTNT